MLKFAHLHKTVYHKALGLLDLLVYQVLVFLEKSCDLSATVPILEEARLKFHQKKKKAAKTI